MASSAFHLLGVTLRLDSDDDGLPREFESLFGGRDDSTAGLPPVEINAAMSFADRLGCIAIDRDGVGDPAEILLSYASATIPFRRVESEDPAWSVLALEGDDEPLFRFRGNECWFPLVTRWRRIVAHYLFLRVLACRPELMFFHAASVSLNGQGVLLIGEKGSGKSTLSAALAARGHAFLGDETAAYSPSEKMLIPFRRPIGIKPGPCASAIGGALARVSPLRDEDSIVRIPIEQLIDVTAAGPVPLRAVVFLRGFAESASLAPIVPGREELASFQPLGSSLRNAPATRRVFELVRILGAASCYTLIAGSPDKTAVTLEEVLRPLWP